MKKNVITFTFLAQRTSDGARHTRHARSKLTKITCPIVLSSESFLFLNSCFKVLIFLKSVSCIS